MTLERDLPPLRRVCIVLLSAVGDVVHALPLVSALKRRDRATHVSWILQPGPASLVRGHPAVDEVILFERRKGWRAFTDLRRRLAERPFDLVIDLQVYLKAGLITAMTRAPVRLGYDRARGRDLNWLFTTHRIPARPPAHVQDEYLEFLEALSIPRDPLEWDLGPWSHERPWQREFFARIGKPAAALVVATSKPEKDWPAERWATVCDALVEDYGLAPVLVGGRSERELAAERAISRHARHQPVSALGTSLRELVGILDGAALAIAPDTGPLHMSVALGRPVVGLYGYTNPKRVGPYRRFHDLLVDAYGDPGEDYPVDAGYRPGRMLRIQPPDVLERVALWRERYDTSVSRPNS